MTDPRPRFGGAWNGPIPGPRRPLDSTSRLQRAPRSSMGALPHSTRPPVWAALAGALLLWTFWVSTGWTQESSQPDAAPNSSPQASLVADRTELTRLRDEVESRIASLDAALLSLEPTEDNEWLLRSYRLERDQLKYLDITYAQHLSLLQIMADVGEEDAAIEAELKQFRDQRLIDGQTSRFAELELLRDAIDKHRARVRTFGAELASGEAIAEVVSERLEGEERHRRSLSEQFDRSDHSIAMKKIERELTTAELTCRISRANLKRQLRENDYRQERLAATEDHLETLEELLSAMRPGVTFAQEDLEQFLLQVRRQENQLRSQVAQLQEQLDATNGEAYRDAVNHESISSLERAVILETIKQLRENLQLRLSFVNASLSELVVIQYCWKLRFDLFHDEIDTEQLNGAQDIANTYLSRLDSIRELTNMQLDEARVNQQSLAARVNEERQRASAVAPWLASYQQALDDLLDIGNQRLAHIQYADSFFHRMQAEVESEMAVETGGASLLGMAGSLRDWWTYELFAVDDNPITLGKLLTAVLMLLLGLFLSKRLSRTVGCRMLPRLGMHEGASLATQTIVFYALTVLCLVFTLELLSIPLTVFTFLGGAAAIAVGFGSQTLLNNFMSGLIILGEQPVRVGDLVEIDGVQGNISHIGARSTKIKTGSNIEIIVPNSKFMEQHLTNWTLSNSEIRTQVNVGVAYGSPTETVIELLSQSLAENEAVLKSPEPIVLFAEFGNDALQFELHFWIEMQTIMQGKRIESDVRRDIDQLFREHDITIAFPQRDVHLDLNRPIEVNVNKPFSASTVHKAA